MASSLTQHPRVSGVHHKHVSRAHYLLSCLQPACAKGARPRQADRRQHSSAPAASSKREAAKLVPTTNRMPTPAVGPARLARRSARRQARWPHVFTPAAQGGSVLTPATSSFNAANDTEQFVCSLAQQQACLCLLVKFPVCRQWVSHATVTD